MYTKICSVCQEEFECGRNGRRRKYCCSCSENLKFKPYVKNCVGCCIEFTISNPREKEKIFCSHSCSAKQSNKNRKITKYCVMCDNPLKKSSKFCSRKCNTTHKKQIKDQEVIDGKSTANRAKKFLIEKYGNICLSPQCAWDFDKISINIEIEHIDGNSENNNLDNLTLLCPNCHSLTPTYKAKNKGNGRAKRMERYHEGKSY